MRFSTLICALPLALAAPAPEIRSPAPLHRRADNTTLPGKYIVKLKQNALLHLLDDVVGTLVKDADHVFEGLFHGFVGSVDEHKLHRLRMNPFVEYIEEDGLVHGAGSWGNIVIEDDQAPWGLARISHREKGQKGYAYEDSAGAGTCAYVVDTGVDDKHPGFGGRAKQLISFVPGQTTDGNGHGTHVAGTIGSDVYGVAKKTRIYGVKVLNNSKGGTWSSIIKGLDYVATDSKTRGCPKGVVVNLSVYGGTSAAMNDAARALVNKGIFLGVCAGNDNKSVSDYSPANVPEVCTVGGTAPDDRRYYYSNWGPLVDIMAPGVDVVSLKSGGGTQKMTGTSMATPHVVGLAAYLAAKEGITGPKACDRIRELATRDKLVDQSPNTVNYIAYNGVPDYGKFWEIFF